MRIPPYPIVLAGPVTWSAVSDASVALASDGCRLPAYEWLCISSFYLFPAECYARTAATLRELIALLDDTRAWHTLGIAGRLDAELPPSPQLKKARDKVVRELRWFADALGAVISSTTVEPPTGSAADSAALIKRRQVLGQSAASTLSCGEALCQLASQVSAWVGDIDTLRSLGESLLVDSQAARPGPAPAAALAAPSPSGIDLPTYSDPPPSDLPSNDPLAETPPAESVLPASERQAPVATPREASRPTGLDQALRTSVTPQAGGVQNPLPYVHRRALAWASAAAALAAARGPSETELESLLEELDRPGVSALAALERAEELLQRYPLWLELQPRVIGWLAQLDAARARDAVRVLFVALYEQCPQLFSPDTRLAGGARVASEPVLTFLREEVARLGELAPPPAPPRSAEFRVELGALQQKAQQASSQRQRFLLRLEMAELCEQRRSFELAVALMTTLIEDSHTVRLGDWEPALMRRATVVFLRILSEREVIVSKEVKVQLQTLLSRLDPLEVAAM